MICWEYLRTEVEEPQPLTFQQNTGYIYLKFYQLTQVCVYTYRSAPEVRNKGKYSEASDIFNLAAVFWEAISLHINTIYQNQPLETFKNCSAQLVIKTFMRSTLSQTSYIYMKEIFQRNLFNCSIYLNVDSQYPCTCCGIDPIEMYVRDFCNKSILYEHTRRTVLDCHNVAVYQQLFYRQLDLKRFN